MLPFLLQFGVSADDTEEMRLKKRLLVFGAIGAAPALCSIGVLLVALGAGVGGWAYIAFSAFMVVVMALFGAHRRLGTTVVVLGVTALASHQATAQALGGFAASGGTPLWGFFFPVLASLVFQSTRATAAWFLLFLLNVAAALFVESDAPRLPEMAQRILFFANIVPLTMLSVGVLAWFVHERDRAFGLLRVEQEKSEALLLNVLPRDIARSLKDTPGTIAQHFDSASILFADLVGFTPLANSLRPAELVELLDEVFSQFDTLGDRYGVEKIKTIGDCYMVAAGVPGGRPDHADALVSLALDMRSYLEATVIRGHRLSLRIGINSGPVVAGVIGRRKFIYDLWGDAVNIASRMESHGVPGQIQITRATWELVRDRYRCTEGGLIAVKGRGDMEVWRVEGATDHAA